MTTNVTMLEQISDLLRREAAQEVGFMYRYFTGGYVVGKGNAIIKKYQFDTAAGILNININLERQKTLQDVPERLTLQIAGHSYRGWFLSVEQQLLRGDNESLQRYALELADAAVEQIAAYLKARAEEPEPTGWQRFLASLRGDDKLMPAQATA